ncbi:MAG: ABC transporter ATP-binding protein [Candidatus Eisenbacteria sp.]|nr:ABC transporter ATP-binding protein [Candidatus Eisenbacteria bacterium]
MIEIKGIEKSFGDHQVLAGVDLTVGTGETMVILGRSGCGKSVLLKLVIGLLKPDSGQVLVGGEPVPYDRPGDLFRMRGKFGMLFQAAALFDSLTVGENVGLGLKENTSLNAGEISRRVKEKLLTVGLDGAEFLKPAELSGGMKKRVGLARALAMDPEYILYDEPTTGLDPVMGGVINELIRDLQHKFRATSIAVTHDIHSAFRIGDRIALLHEGRIVHVGTVAETKATRNPVVEEFIEGQSG